DPQLLIRALYFRGITTVVTHPERHTWIINRPQYVAAWLEEGCVLQVNACSLTGVFGKAAEQAAWYWLERGQVALVATDAHSVGKRAPQMTEALALMEQRVGHAVARQLCVENPQRLVNGQQL